MKTKLVVSAADQLAERVSDRAIGGGVPLEDWLQQNAGEWAMQYKMSVFPEAKNKDSQLHFAAAAGFRCGTALACHVLRRGRLDKSYAKLWRELLEAAKRDVEQFQKENDAYETEPAEAPLPKKITVDADELDLREVVEAQIGAWILDEMEGLEWMADGPEGNRTNIQAGMRDGMGHGLFDDLWELYLKIHPEQGRGTDASDSPPN